MSSCRPEDAAAAPSTGGAITTTPTTATTMPTTPLASRGSRVGPVFSVKDHCAFVKTAKEDAKRAVVNLSNMTLVKYADRHEYPEGPLRSDQSLFVPIFCKECYGTEEEDYAEALAGVAACGSRRFLVGMCCVFGAAQSEEYPESRKAFAVENAVSYAAACHLQPGKAVFLHKVKQDIGRVKCYWHVHSRSADKTFLYCCVACDDNVYANGVTTTTTEMSTGFSLGTVGDNKSGPVTEECSLVSVPMRPGCFCTPVTGEEELVRTMTRMGFSIAKDSVLDAGAALPTEEEESVGAERLPDGSDGRRPEEQRSDIAETVETLRRAVLDQAAEVRALKDLLEAMKVQNSVLTRRLKCPDDPDALFTVRGAKDFTRRTGVKTRLCAGATSSDEGTNAKATDPTAPTPEPYHRESMADATVATQTQHNIDTLIKLLQQQQQQPQPQQQQPQQPQSHEQLQALQRLIQVAPILEHFILPQTRQHLPQHQHFTQHHHLQQQQQQQQHQQQQQQQQPGYHPGTLTDEQRRKIAMEYNKEESERQAASQKEYEKMLDSIKASIRDVILEQQQQQKQQHQHSSVSQEASSKESDMDTTLQSLARDTPYKRTRRQVKDDAGDISTLINELRELTKQISKRGDSGAVEESGRAAPMDTEDAGSPAASASDETQRSQPCSSQRVDASVATKQQAGYSAPSSRGGSAKASTAVARDVTDFISAVVAKTK